MHCFLMTGSPAITPTKSLTTLFNTSMAAYTRTALRNFWSLLKRGISGTYVSVEPFHLFRYLDEQSFRYNYRKEMNDFDRFRLALSQIAGKRLTYKHLTGKEMEPPSAVAVN